MKMECEPLSRVVCFVLCIFHERILRRSRAMFTFQRPKERPVCCDPSFATVNIGLALFFLWVVVVLVAWGVRLGTSPASAKNWDANILGVAVWSYAGVFLAALLGTLVARSHKLKIFITTEAEYYRRIPPTVDESDLWSIGTPPRDKQPKTKPINGHKTKPKSEPQREPHEPVEATTEIEVKQDTIEESTSAETHLANAVQQQLDTEETHESKEEPDVQEQLDGELASE